MTGRGKKDGLAAMDGNGPRGWGLSRNAVKAVAMVSMAVDHSACAFESMIPPGIHDFMRLWIGRAAYPIFLVLFVEGFMRTKRPVAHLRDLLVFAVLAEPFSDMALYGAWYYPGWQNVMWSWLLGGCVVVAFRYAADAVRDGSLAADGALLCRLAAMFAGSLVGWKANLDYGVCQALVVAIAYAILASGRKRACLAACVACCIVVGCLSNTPGVVFAIPFMAAYDPGKPCMKNPVLRYAGYAFYPAHMAVLAIVRIVVGA